MAPTLNRTLDPDTAKTHRLLLVLLLAFASLVQFTVVSRTHVPSPLRSDAGAYFSYAYNLATYGVYSSTKTWLVGADHSRPSPDKSRPPGYPVFLLAVGNPTPTASYMRRVAYLQAALGVLCVWLTYLIASRFLSRTGALLAGALVVISPHITLSSTLILSEGLFTFLMLASTLASVRAFEDQRLPWFVAAGLLWGTCTLVRPTTILFPALLGAWALLTSGRHRWLRPVAAGVLAFAMVLAPWFIRNLSVPPDSSLLLNSVAHGSYPQFMVDGRRETWAFPYRFDPAYPAYARTPSTLVAELERKFARDPATMLGWYLVGKPVYLLSLKDLQSLDIQIYPPISTPYYERGPYAVMRAATILLHGPLMALGVLGALLAWVAPGQLREVPGARVAAGTVALLLAYVIALHVAMAPYPRYAIPFRPLIFALAVFTLERGWWAVRRRMRAPA